MSNIENVKVGDFIIVTSESYRPEMYMPTFGMDYQPAVVRSDGDPIKVIGIAAPFVLCLLLTEPKSPTVVDSRHENWTKCRPAFVRAYCKAMQLTPPKSIQTKADKDDSKRKCPECLGTMTERAGGDEKWYLCCKPCGKQFVPLEWKKR